MALFAFAKVGEDDNLAEDVGVLRAEVEEAGIHWLLCVVAWNEHTVSKETKHPFNFLRFVTDTLQVTSCWLQVLI